MKPITHFLLASSLAFLTAPAMAAVGIDFEGIAPYPNNNDVAILQFYNGGLSSIGTTGVNVGVSFAPNAKVLCLNQGSIICSTFGRDGVGNTASKPAGLYFGTDPTTANGGLFGRNSNGPNSAAGSTFLDISAGFSGAISFTYAAGAGGARVSVLSGAGGIPGQGQVLAFVDLPGNALGCAPDSATLCPFSPVTLNFGGIGRSVVFAGIDDETGFDDIVLGRVPEPASWAMMVIGFGLMGGALRRRSYVNSASNP